ncbi:MAG: EamA/RhaT family transporter, partial [Ilumatobacteraceae bacterium]
MSNSQQQSLARVAPAIFVALWSTGFVVARYATTDAGPLTFLSVR